MALELGPVVSGPYTGDYNSVDLGVQVEGYRLALEYLGKPINQTDLYGETMIDFVKMGLNGRIQWRSWKYDPQAAGPLTPFGTVFGQVLAAANPMGASARNAAAALTLTAVANTPTATTPASLTASKAILAPGTTVERLFGTEPTQTPITMQLLPYESTSNVASLFTTT